MYKINTEPNGIVPIEIYPKVLDFLCANIKLTSKLKSEFTNLFGKHNKVYRFEFLEYVWFLEYKDNLFCVYTGNRGTSIYFEYDESINKSEIIIEFLNELIIKLC